MGVHARLASRSAPGERGEAVRPSSKAVSEPELQLAGPRSGELRFATPLQRGFTLIELLLSISIFAIVLIAANGVLFGAIRLRNKTTENLARGLALERATGILRKDIASIVAPNGSLSGSLQSDSNGLDSGKGRPVSPELYINTGLINDRSNWGEVLKVAYYLRTPTNKVATQGLDLVRAVTRNLLPPTQEDAEDQWLLGGVSRLAFTYYNGTQWQQSWNSTNETTVLPTAIKVEIVMAQDNSLQGNGLAGQNPSVQLVVPILVTGDTNQTTQTSGGQP